MVEFKCPICGSNKVILCHEEYAYKVGRKLFCSYGCWVKYRKAHPKALSKHYHTIAR